MRAGGGWLVGGGRVDWLLSIGLDRRDGVCLGLTALRRVGSVICEGVVYTRIVKENVGEKKGKIKDRKEKKKTFTPKP